MIQPESAIGAMLVMTQEEALLKLLDYTDFFSKKKKKKKSKR